MAHRQSPFAPGEGAGVPFRARLATGQEVEVHRLGPDSRPAEAGSAAMLELADLLRNILAIGPHAAAAHGLSLPAAWAARAPDAAPVTDLGIAWWTPLPWHRPTAIAEIVLAPGLADSGLGQVLLDLLVLSATDCGAEWLQVRLPAERSALAEAVRRLKGRPLVDDPGRVEIPLAAGQRRYHRSGFHRRQSRATSHPTGAPAPGDLT